LSLVLVVSACPPFASPGVDDGAAKPRRLWPCSCRLLSPGARSPRPDRIVDALLSLPLLLLLLPLLLLPLLLPLLAVLLLPLLLLLAVLLLPLLLPLLLLLSLPLSLVVAPRASGLLPRLVPPCLRLLVRLLVVALDGDRPLRVRRRRLPLLLTDLDAAAAKGGWPDGSWTGLPDATPTSWSEHDSPWTTAKVPLPAAESCFGPSWDMGR
jgi:hypothetical protein